MLTVSQFVIGIAVFVFISSLGIIAMALSVIFHFSKKPNASTAFILAVIGTVLLAPAAVMAVMSFGDGIMALIDSGALQQRMLWIVIPVLIVIYDIMVIQKYIQQKKNKPTEEQQNG